MGCDRGERLRRLAAAVRNAEQAITADRLARDEEIQAADADGMSVTDIARFCQMSATSIVRVIARGYQPES